METVETCCYNSRLFVCVFVVSSRHLGLQYSRKESVVHSFADPTYSGL